MQQRCVENNCTENAVWGIAVRFWSDDNTVADNLCNNNGIGIFLRIADHNTISGNDVIGNTGEGIALTEGSDHNDVLDNYCESNDYGILVEDSTFNTLDNNEVIQYGMEHGAIFILRSHDNTIINNIVRGKGLAVYHSDRNLVMNNDCQDSARTGIYLGYAIDNDVIDNECHNNDEWGIYLGPDCDLNTVEGNDVSGNGIAGLALRFTTNTEILDNTFTDNPFGVMINESQSNTMIGNTIESNDCGIYLKESEGTLIYWNNILYNTIQAEDIDSPSSNDWYNPVLLEGNVWSCYIGVDWDRDGIGDTDVPWPGEGFDMYPLVTDDFDNDGLSYYGELEIGTDPYNDDTDGDFFKDGDEWRYFFSDPTVFETPAQVSVVVDESLEELVEEEVLDDKDVSPLLKKLDAARDLMDKGKLFQATQKLGDFIDQINAMINKGKLTEEEGNALIALAQALIDVILTM
jgi:parallel beta-helix repeat protein